MLVSEVSFRNIDFNLAAEETVNSDRARRIRYAVEAASSDIIGIERQVRLAERAVREMVAGHPIHTRELVVLLRAFIREALNLDAIHPTSKSPHSVQTDPPVPARRATRKRKFGARRRNGWRYDRRRHGPGWRLGCR